MYTIHGMSQSFNTTKVLYTAEELGISYDFHELDFTKGEQQSPEHIKRHPLGKTPTMTFDGKTLFESGAICRYLAASTQTDLYGKNPFEKALTDQWMDFFSIHAGRWIGSYAFEKKMRKQFNMGEPKQEVINEAHGFLEQQLGMVNVHLGEQKHLVGDTFTIADLFAFAYMEAAVDTDFPVASYKNLHTWFSALKERPCVMNCKKKLNPS